MAAMRPIRLPEPPCVTTGIPDIFEGGVNVVRRAIVIGNGFSGAENQSIGLVRALGLADKLSIYRVTRPRGGVNEWLHWLPLSLHKVLDNLISQIFGNSAFGMLLRGRKLDSFCVQNDGYVGLSSILEADATKIATIARETFEKEGPLLVVASGRDTISAASSIKRLASENVFVIQIQHPRSGLDRFDLVVTPCHDYYALTASGQQEIPRIMRRWITPREPPGKNVVVTVGALHQADYAALRVAATIWHDELAPLPKPLLVVNVGGPTRNCKYTSKLARQLVGSLQNVLASCGSVRISFSRRTPGKVSEIILRELGGHPKIYIWDGEDPNQHMGHLAWADAFIITADSISLVSEACSIGKPVYVIGSEHCKWKFSTFHKTLCERGLVRPFTGLEDDPYHGAGQAMGLAFSVPESVKIPSSLINIFKELQEDLGCSVPLNGNLERWAAQGVLLLNTVLTVRNHQANSHAKKGWEPFTDAIIRTISQKKSGAVFLLWGISAQVKARMIDGSKHHILKAAHPSGLSANKGFFGCRLLLVLTIPTMMLIKIHEIVQLPYRIKQSSGNP